MAALACPQCLRADQLSTVEQLTGTCGAQITRRPDGSVFIENDGDTDLDWDGSTSIGVACGNCAYRDAAAGWESRLVGVPDLAARVAAALAAHDTGGGAPAPDARALADAVLAVDAARLDDPRVRLLAEIVRVEVPGHDATDWTLTLPDVYTTVAAHAHTVDHGVLADAC